MDTEMKPAGPCVSKHRTERRACRSGSSVPPEILVAGALESSRRQLDAAREDLKAARRRVVQLEEVVETWQSFGQCMLEPVAL